MSPETSSQRKKAARIVVRSDRSCCLIVERFDLSLCRADILCELRVLAAQMSLLLSQLGDLVLRALHGSIVGYTAETKRAVSSTSGSGEALIMRMHVMLTSKLRLHLLECLIELSERLLRGDDIALRLQTRSLRDVVVSTSQRTLLVHAISSESDGVEIVVARQSRSDAELTSDQSLACTAREQRERKREEHESEFTRIVVLSHCGRCA